MTFSGNVVKLHLMLLWIIIPVVSLYKHNICVSDKLSITKECQQINNTMYWYSSITEVFQQLSNCCNFTDITIEPGNYNLALSYTFADLHDIRIRSETKAVIQCAANVNGTYDFDTGIAFVRVRNLIITNISIVGCGMKHISTNYIGAGKYIIVRSALYIQNSTNIFLDNVNISESNGIGLLIYDTNGSVNITKTYFINNTLNSSEQSEHFTGGGGIYIEFTECPPGVTQCNSTSNTFNKLANYTIDNCVFEGNVANYTFHGSKPEGLANETSVTFGTGGGISLWLYGNAHNNSFKIISTLFISNRAPSGGGGGGIYMENRQNASSNTIEILSSCFYENFAVGGGGLALGYSIYQMGGQSLFNTFIVAHCLFKENQGRVGGGISGFGSREPHKRQPTNYFEICNCSFIRNRAQYGSAIQINKEYFDSIVVGTRYTLVLTNCTFNNNSLHGSNSSSIGAVAMSGVNVEFRGATVFSNNTSTALVADRASVRFGNDSVTIFQDNSGLYGGAISLIGGAWISLYPNSNITFLRNMAIQYGGAIYVELSAPFDYLVSRVCFMKYYKENRLPSEWMTNVTFINNTAIKTNTGNTIFANTLNPCAYMHSYSAEPIPLFDHPFHYSNYSPKPVVSTSPCNFVFPKGNVLTVVPGETFNLLVELVDELNQTVSSPMFIATCNGPSSPYVQLPYHFTNGSIQLAGKPSETCELQLETDANYQVSSTVWVTLLNCPPGFMYSNETEECVCMVDHEHQNPVISDCELTSYRAYFNQFYWIGYESDDADNLLISPCPYRYCYEDYISQGQLLPRDANKATLDKFVCGNRSRTGLLCGECIEGYSVVMNSPTFTCYRCKDPHLGILYLLLSYIIPVSILFYIIMAYNIRMTTGPIGAFLFFSQIFSSQYRFAFEYSITADKTLTASSIITAIYSITNLQFFQHNLFSYCLFQNAGTIDILAFNLILSCYPICLVLTYFLLRRYCSCKVRCFQRFRFSTTSVTHGVCAFLVLCFAKINVLAFGILKSAEISYINGTSFRKVVSLQGSLTYFGDLLYDVYAVGSLFTIVTVISIPTMILVFHPILIGVARYFEWGDTKCVVLINKILLIHKLKPVLDSFQGDYKDNLCFFAGLHWFFYRIVFFSVVVAVSSPDIDDLLLLIIIFFVIILLIHVLAMPFKHHIDNVSYTLIYILMLTIVIIEFYLYVTGKSSHVLIWLEVFLSLLPLICVILYCLWKILSVGRKFWKKLCRVDESELVSTLIK